MSTSMLNVVSGDQVLGGSPAAIADSTNMVEVGPGSRAKRCAVARSSSKCSSARTCARKVVSGGQYLEGGPAAAADSANVVRGCVSSRAKRGAGRLYLLSFRRLAFSKGNHWPAHHLEDACGSHCCGGMAVFGRCGLFCISSSGAQGLPTEAIPKSIFFLADGPGRPRSDTNLCWRWFAEANS